MKNEQHFEPCGTSIDSAEWHLFELKRQSFENTRTPLRKLADPKIRKHYAHNSNIIVNTEQSLMAECPTLPGKRKRKQKRLNPDEVYYYNTFIKGKRKLAGGSDIGKAAKKCKVIDGHD